MKASVSAVVAGLFVAGAVSVSWAADFDGRWAGSGDAAAGSCPDFRFSVQVENQKVQGAAENGTMTFDVLGALTQDGRFEGQVVYAGWKIAQLNGDVRSDGGRGTWRTVMGPDCHGTFAVNRVMR
jgi:hypothetical protein